MAVAALSLLLALFTRLPFKDRLARRGPQGFAERGHHLGIGLRDKVLGIVGLGNIGVELVKLVQPLGMRTIAYHPRRRPTAADQLDVEMTDLDTLVRLSDAVVLICPLTDETRHLINRERLRMMKPGSYLINIARGPVVDQRALVEALQQKWIAGAGLDVFDPEPPSADDPLLSLDNVILAPHSLGWTDELFADMAAEATQSVLSVMRGEVPESLVNPSIAQNEAWRDKLRTFRG